MKPDVATSTAPAPRAAAPAPLALVVFAKAPVAGRVKTRLTPDLAPEQAAELQAALLQDTGTIGVAVAAGTGPAVTLWCAVAGIQDEIVLRALLPAQFSFVQQGSGSLGDRLAHVFGTLLASHRAVLAIGADCAELTGDLLRDALGQLSRCDAVLGEARDGGYWAIGTARSDSRLFQEIPWSTAGVAADTRRRLAELGWSVADLPVLGDLDRFADLRKWARRPNLAFSRTLEWCRGAGLG